MRADTVIPAQAGLYTVPSRRSAWISACAGMTCLLLLALLLTPAWAGVPNKNAPPATPEEQTLLQTEKDVAEQGLSSLDSGKVHVDRHFLGQYGDTERTVILQRGGNTWRTWRNGPFATVSGALVLVVPLLIFGFYVAVGPMRTGRPDSGRRIERFNAWDRTIHWSTAISFLILAISGLVLLFGKLVMMPWMGHDLFAWIAIVCKYLHNFVGPLFIVCSVLMFITFARKNKFKPVDWAWLKGGGGLVSHKHIPAGYFNAGEKLWFWCGVALLGLLMSVTGLVMDFVNFGQTRYLLQIADYLHIAGATLYIVAAMAHIYIGTIGTPGAYEAMRHGTVDEEWAKVHHELWYEEIKAGGAPPSHTPPRGAQERPGY